MTREEKIIHIAGLCNIRYPQEECSDPFDPRRYENIINEVLHKETLDYLNSCSDEELDIIIDKVWETIHNFCLKRPLPEDL